MDDDVMRMLMGEAASAPGAAAPVADFASKNQGGGGGGGGNDDELFHSLVEGGAAYSSLVDEVLERRRRSRRSRQGTDGDDDGGGPASLIAAIKTFSSPLQHLLLLHRFFGTTVGGHAKVSWLASRIRVSRFRMHGFSNATRFPRMFLHSFGSSTHLLLYPQSPTRA